MRVRVCVHVKDRDCVKNLVHATLFEPVHIDAEQGILAFDVPYGQVENVLNRLAKTGVSEFQAHTVPIPK